MEIISEEKSLLKKHKIVINFIYKYKIIVALQFVKHIHKIYRSNLENQFTILNIITNSEICKLPFTRRETMVPKNDTPDCC